MPSRHPRSQSPLRAARPALSRQILHRELADIEVQHQDHLLFTAAVTAGAFVARADGWVDPAECHRLADWVAGPDGVAGFSRHDVVEAFALRLRQFDQPDGVAAAVDTLKRAAGLKSARMVVAGAEIVARADGQVQPAEADALRLVRRTMFPATAQP